MLLKLKPADIAGLSRNLEEFRRQITTATRDPRFLNSVGALLVSRGKQNLEDGAAGGKSYTLLKPATKREKRRRGYSLKPLQRTGLMRRSLGHEVPGGELQLTGIDIIKHHQYGAPRAGIPKREIYTIENDDIQDIQGFLERSLKRNALLQ